MRRILGEVLFVDDIILIDWTPSGANARPHVWRQTLESIFKLSRIEIEYLEVQVQCMSYEAGVDMKL